MIEFNVVPYRLRDGLQGAAGRIVRNDRLAIIRLREPGDEETIDFLLKKAESGIAECPLCGSALRDDEGGICDACKVKEGLR